MHKLAIIGNPVAHSLSPRIFSSFGEQTGIKLDYQKICAEIDSFEQVVTTFFAAGGLAVNVTAPFKARAYALANRHLPDTHLSQTANVLIHHNGLISADNTDGLGLVADLERSGVKLAAKNILILGSGSVIFSILNSLERERPGRIDLLMRDSSKIEQFYAKSQLVEEFDSNVSYDLLINTTPDLAENQLFDQIKDLSSTVCIYDMIYTSQQTRFMQQMLAQRPAGQAKNGIGMLIQQAKVGFERIFGISPDVEPLYRLLQI